MTNDPLRDRIARTDPLLGGADVPPVSSDSSQRLLEDIMNNPIDSPIDTPTPATTAKAGGRSPRRWQWAAAAAAVAALAIAGAALGGAFGNDDGEISTADPAVTAPGKLTVLELSTGDAGPTMATCIQLSPEIVAMSQLAFRGTADMVEGDLVTLLVDHWYVGGDAGQVTLTAPSGMEGLTGSIDFQPGVQYIIAAYDGVVSYCGLSGEATPELTALYDAAFPG